MIKLNLDQKNDVLYVAFSDMKKSYGDEIQNGVVVFYDIDDDSVTGVTIFDFMERYKNKRLEELKIPCEIDFRRDVYPKLQLQ